MSRAHSPLEMPKAPNGGYDTVGSLSNVLFTGPWTYTIPGTGQKETTPVPIKQVTLHNDTKQTIYPFLYDPNTGQSSDGGYFDPFDQHEQQYRAYIGYRVGKTDYLGLKPRQSITLDVPLVFWDSGRMCIGTSSAKFLPADTNTNPHSAVVNPFRFYYYNKDAKTPTARFVVPAVHSSEKEGIVMFYHCLSNQAPSPDATSGLAEWSYRDKDFLTKISKYYPNNPITDRDLLTSVNYDVSYVDSFSLPVAMEATNVPVPNTGAVGDYAWIGAKNPFSEGKDNFQKLIKRFISHDPSNGLGAYFRFDGKDHGWPHFYNPTNEIDPDNGIQIPSGYVLYASGPLANVRSSYNNDRWMLSSGGDGPIVLHTSATASSKNTLKITAVVGEHDIEKALKTLKEGMSVTHGTTTLGTIASVDVQARTVTLNTDSLSTGTSYSPDFHYPVRDPYVKKITNLWYSWASYYRNLPEIKNFKTQTLQAMVSADTDRPTSDFRIVTFPGQAQPKLPLGALVTTGAGAQPLTTIMKIVKNGDSVSYYLSRPLKSAGEQSLTFSAPRAIVYSGETHTFPIDFKDASHREQEFAKAFAATVYETLSVYSTASIKERIYLPMSDWIVQESIGGNVGHLPTAAPVDYVSISGDARDLVKSALRGVPNYYTTPEKDWYPAPSKPTGDQPYNVFNLDPYVWFIHEELHLSGYGFSLDDETADVDAPGGTTLSIAVGGLLGLENKYEYALTAPYGTVRSQATITDSGDTSVISLKGEKGKIVYNQLKASDPKNGLLVGAHVSGPGIAPGTTLEKTAIISDNEFVLSQKATPTTPGQTVELTFSGRPLS